MTRIQKPIISFDICPWCESSVTMAGRCACGACSLYSVDAKAATMPEGTPFVKKDNWWIATRIEELAVGDVFRFVANKSGYEFNEITIHKVSEIIGDTLFTGQIKEE